MQKRLTEKYVKKIKPISIEGVKGSIWERKLLLDFLKSEDCIGYAILDGDVLEEIGNVMKYTYDSWGIEDRENGESFDAYCERSKKIAIEYIENYPHLPNIIFSPVITSEVTAGL